jgi:Mg2+ and Co2+ transporter CorA
MPHKQMTLKWNEVSMTNKTCSELINEKMRDREEFIQKLIHYHNRSIDIPEDEDYNEYSLLELPIGIDKKTVITLCLSWGGPADYLDITLDNTNTIVKVEYRYEDWFDGAKVKVDEKSPLWHMAEIFVEIDNQ